MEKQIDADETQDWLRCPMCMQWLHETCFEQCFLTNQSVRRINFADFRPRFRIRYVFDTHFFNMFPIRLGIWGL